MQSVHLLQLAVQNVRRVVADKRLNGKETTTAVRLLCFVLERTKPPRLERKSSTPVDAAIEASRCKALLLAILVRAAHDLILYRSSARLEKRQLAQDAYTWLFEEQEGHPHHVERQRSQRLITSFCSICDVLDIDPTHVRTNVLKLDVRTILNAGRPPENRKRRGDIQEACFSLHAIERLVDGME